jgi:hypothetical protein
MPTRESSFVGKILGLLLVAIVLAAILGAALFWFLRNPVASTPRPADARNAAIERLKADVEFLTGLAPSRNARNLESLNKAASYIANAFAQAGCAPREQPFTVNGTEYKNIICSFGAEEMPRLVIGAHYDVAGENNPGADDNASGVAGILELARLIGAAKPKLPHRVDLVAFTLEEQPHFRPSTMGSQIYADELVAGRTPLKLMISVEMIGYFQDRAGSQGYPIGALKLIYPNTADFIAIVGRPLDRSPVARVKMLMTVTDALPVYSINAPRFLRGVDFSDHRSFWQHDLPAVMVTDTAFFRNPNYHRSTDLSESLDFRRMAMVVDGLYQVAVRY